MASEQTCAVAFSIRGDDLLFVAFVGQIRFVEFGAFAELLEQHCLSIYHCTFHCRLQLFVQGSAVWFCLASKDMG